MELPLHPACRVLASGGRALFALEKAPGVLSHPNTPRDRTNTLLDLPYDTGKEVYAGGAGAWYLLNRLDGPTSGIILLSGDPAEAAAVKEAFARHVVEKTYLAVVKGVPPRKRDVWRDCLSVKRRGGTLRTTTATGKPNAETTVQLLRSAASPPARSLLSLSPVTGRTHQLRVQCAARRLPIVGDATYGDFNFNREFRRRAGGKRLFLHSHRLALSYELDGQSFRFSAESPAPAEFSIALE